MYTWLLTCQSHLIRELTHVVTYLSKSPHERACTRGLTCQSHLSKDFTHVDLPVKILDFAQVGHVGLQMLGNAREACLSASGCDCMYVCMYMCMCVWMHASRHDKHSRKSCPKHQRAHPTFVIEVNNTNASTDTNRAYIQLLTRLWSVLALVGCKHGCVM